MDKARQLETDPVCGEAVDPEDCEYIAKFHGKAYYFCSLSCQLDFQEVPEKYLGQYA